MYLEIISENQMPDGGGERKNEGKVRYGLEPYRGRVQSVQNLMNGAKKYSDWNWARGMSWTTVLECIERHTMKIKMGEDIDAEDGLLHAAKIITNAQFLIEYFHTYPQGDDRRFPWLDRPKVGLDIDEVCADWVGAWIKIYGGGRPSNWHFDYRTKERLLASADDEDFWLDILPIFNPLEMPFEPHCYITSRPCSTEITMEWLRQNHFPTRPVYTVGMGESKIGAAEKSGLDWFVDDNFDTFVEFNKAGIPCFLFDRTHNQRYDVGAKRIKHLRELPGFAK